MRMLTPFKLSRRTVLSIPFLAAFTSKPRTRVYKYEIWDVFTDRPLAGNPLAVFTEAQTLSTEETQAIARELFAVNRTHPNRPLPIPPQFHARTTDSRAVASVAVNPVIK
jgi:hypothetical protein